MEIKKSIVTAVLSLSALLGGSCAYEEKPNMARPVEEQSHDYNLLKNEFDQYKEKTEQRLVRIEQGYAKSRESLVDSANSLNQSYKQLADAIKNAEYKRMALRAKISDLEQRVESDSKRIDLNNEQIKSYRDSARESQK